MILVDSNIWIDFFRSGRTDGTLARKIGAQLVLVHPAVTGEIALGNLGAWRGEVLAMLAAQPRPPVLNDDEILHVVESHRLFGSGIGWIDAHLIGSALLAEATLWTSDRFLARAGLRCGVEMFAENGG